MPPLLSGPQPEQNRLAVGFNQPPGSGDLYPFVAPSSDITQLLGDLFVSFDDVEDEFVYPLKVAWMAAVLSLYLGQTIGLCQHMSTTLS